MGGAGQGSAGEAGGKPAEGVQRGRYMTLETIAGLCNEPIIKLPAVAA